jgi:hypothetical protein
LADFEECGEFGSWRRKDLTKWAETGEDRLDISCHDLIQFVDRNIEWGENGMANVR